MKKSRNKPHYFVDGDMIRHSFGSFQLPPNVAAKWRTRSNAVRDAYVAARINYEARKWVAA